MADNASGLIRSSKKLGALGLGSFAVAAAFMSLGSGTASAVVEEVAPTPSVTSRQALVIDSNALRITAPGEARGFLDTRLGDAGILHGQSTVSGELAEAYNDSKSDSVKAVVGTTAAPFNLEQNGSFQLGPPIGDW